MSVWLEALRFIFACRFGPYFASPVIAGLEQDGKAYLCGMDSIGAIETAHDFMVAGTAPDSLYGMCESMWRPDLVCANGSITIDVKFCVCCIISELACRFICKPNMLWLKFA